MSVSHMKSYQDRLQNSTLQFNIDVISVWTESNNMRLNVLETLRTVSFLRDSLLFDNLSSSGSNIEILHDFKLLGVTVSSNFTWKSCQLHLYQSKQTIVYS